ncbi:velvet factor-domain-containing protein [Gorgonomyces haynaldii]|nr:velvet factor-domain-containing protein [Gorgonomyces haynaldii]
MSEANQELYRFLASQNTEENEEENKKFKFIIRQQPTNVQLIIVDPEKEEDKPFLHNPFFFVYASLVDPESLQDLSTVKNYGSRVMTGSVASSLYRMKDLDNSYGAFFVFPDISIREKGQFRLKFTLFEIDKRGPHVSECEFPGVGESSALTRFFAEQGLKFKIRKGSVTKKTTGKRNNDDSDESNSETQDVAPAPPPRKQARSQEEPPKASPQHHQSFSQEYPSAPAPAPYPYPPPPQAYGYPPAPYYPDSYGYPPQGLPPMRAPGGPPPPKRFPPDYGYPAGPPPNWTGERRPSDPMVERLGQIEKKDHSSERVSLPSISHGKDEPKELPPLQDRPSEHRKPSLPYAHPVSRDQYGYPPYPPPNYRMPPPPGAYSQGPPPPRDPYGYPPRDPRDPYYPPPPQGYHQGGRDYPYPPPPGYAPGQPYYPPPGDRSRPYPPGPYPPRDLYPPMKTEKRDHQ